MSKATPSDDLCFASKSDLLSLSQAPGFAAELSEENAVRHIAAKETLRRIDHEIWRRLCRRSELQASTDTRACGLCQRRRADDNKRQSLTNWWHTFNDPLLDRFVSQASTNNYDLRHAQARLREARALWTEARFDFAPTVRASAGYQKYQLSEDAAGTRARRNELYRAGFDATWELDIWGDVRRNVEAARATVESVEATRDDMLVAIQAEVAANYFDVRGTQLQLEVARLNATNQTQTLELAIALLNGGQGTQLDVARGRFSTWSAP